MNKCTESDSWKIAHIKAQQTVKLKIAIKIEEYNKNPNKCVKCDKNLEYARRKNKFCNRSCAAAYNNLGVARNKKEGFKYSINLYERCIYCGSEIENNYSNHKYCSRKCMGLHKTEIEINHWKNNFINITKLPRGVRKYLIEQSNNKCSICGWGEVNQYSGNPALIVDHIDGNSEHNSPDNLRVICPNCDSLLPTYKGLNKGNGRAYRRQRYADGKSH